MDKLIKNLRQQYNEQIIKELQRLVKEYPDQRFGQICCNYLFPFYRERDMFFEESKDTLSTVKSFK